MGAATTTKLTTKGQITIPKATREFLKIGPGDRVKLFLHPDGHVAILPVTSIDKLHGFVKYSGEPVTIHEMDEAISKAAAKRDRQSRSAR